MGQHPGWQKALTWFSRFVGFEFLLFAPMKFYPHGIGSYPSYFEKFTHWGYPWWFSMVIGAAEIIAGLLSRRRRCLGAVIVLFVLTGAITTHIVNHDVLKDSVAAPLHWAFALIIALGSWPADWREPFALRRLDEAPRLQGEPLA